MRRVLTNLSLVALLAVGGTSVAQVIRSAPAFNAELRQANAFGDVTVLLGSEMYDRPAYLYQQAASFIFADLVPTFDAGNVPRLATPEEAIARAAQGVALIEESLAIDPGNAGGWNVLAWSQLMRGDFIAARAALQTSWALAPYSLAFAPERIEMALTLFDPDLAFGDTQNLQMTQEEKDALVRDSQTLWLQRRNLHRIYREQALAMGFPAFEPPEQG